MEEPDEGELFARLEQETVDLHLTERAKFLKATLKEQIALVVGLGYQHAGAEFVPRATALKTVPLEMRDGGWHAVLEQLVVQNTSNTAWDINSIGVLVSGTWFFQGCERYRLGHQDKASMRARILINPDRFNDE